MLCGAAGHYAVAAMLHLTAARLPSSAGNHSAETAEAARLCERYAALTDFAISGDSDEWLYGRAG